MAVSSSGPEGMVDLNKFRLRRFVEKLNKLGEVDVIEKPTDLSDLATLIEENPRAIWFKDVGPDNLEIVASVNGSRYRLAKAMDVSPDNLVSEYRNRLKNPQPVIEIKNPDAPVQKVVLTGKDADLSRLPFYVQHQLDGSPYISSAIDYTVDPETGTTNVGCRRLSLRNSKEAGTNLTAPSDLKRIYTEACEKGKKLDISFAIGSHPIDYLAAGMRIPADEISLVSTLRGEPLPLVKSISNDIRVPADAEMIVEGYLDERGYIEPDGPYGEYVGFYGPMHQDPVFHVTAITMREDVLHQTLFHGAGLQIHRAESVHLMSVGLEAKALTILENENIDVRDVFVPPSSAEGQHLRVSIAQKHAGDVKKVISALINNMFVTKHVFVVDEDINIRDENNWEWALVSRLQADRDIFTFPERPGMPMDPSLDAGKVGTKAGFDLTLPIKRRGELMLTIATAPKIKSAKRFKSAREAISEGGAMFLSDIIAAVGSKDGREVIMELDEIRQDGKLMRDKDGRYLIGDSTKGITGISGPQYEDPNS